MRTVYELHNLHTALRVIFPPFHPLSTRNPPLTLVVLHVLRPPSLRFSQRLYMHATRALSVCGRAYVIRTRVHEHAL